MGARTGSLSLVLASGQVQRVLVEAGSTLIVSEGRGLLRYPFTPLAEQLVSVEVSLVAEEVRSLPDGGWIDLVAMEAATFLILSPENAGLLARLGKALAGAIAMAGVRCRSNAGQAAVGPRVRNEAVAPSLRGRSSTA